MNRFVLNGLIHLMTPHWSSSIYIMAHTIWPSTSVPTTEFIDTVLGDHRNRMLAVPFGVSDRVSYVLAH